MERLFWLFIAALCIWWAIYLLTTPHPAWKYMNEEEKQWYKKWFIFTRLWDKPSQKGKNTKMSSKDDRIAELEDEVQDLTTELEHARDEIDVLQDEVDSFEDRYDEGYREGYDKALENAINAVEELK